LVKRRHELSSSRSEIKQRQAHRTLKWRNHPRPGPIRKPGKILLVANSEDYLLRTGPCSVRRNRLNLGASPPAGPALQTGGSTGAESDSRETLKSYLNSTARRNWKINCGRNVRFRGWDRAAGIAFGANWGLAGTKPNRDLRNEAKFGDGVWWVRGIDCFPGGAGGRGMPRPYKEQGTIGD
jgi:hypothetical protein